MSDKMGEKRGMKALEAWCKKVTQGYKGVKIDNMTTSWRDGLAFCAIIHHFRPELIDFDSLDKNDIYRNNELAFRTAERHLGIPALLDPEDMVEYPVPDRLSILTYLSQFYQTFVGIQEGSSETPKRVPKLRSSTEEDASEDVKSPPVKVAAPVIRRDPCAKCGLPVFIAERLLVGGNLLYHRTCFRCARCQNQLSLANCYETEDGQHCCETCPDEVPEEKTAHSASFKTFSELDIIGNVGLDDEYSKQFESLLGDSSDDNQEYSKQFESLLEDSNAVYQESSDILLSEKLPLKFSKARSDFMTSQLSSDIDDSAVASLNSTEQNISGTEASTFMTPNRSPSSVLSASQISSSSGEISKIEADQNKEPESFLKSSLSVENRHSPGLAFDSIVASDEVCDRYSKNITDKNYENNYEKNSVVQAVGASNAESVVDDSSVKDSIKASEEPIPLGGSFKCEDEVLELHGVDEYTKETDHIKTQASSIVKMRLKMFESSGVIIKEKETKTNTNNKKFADIRRNSEEDSSSLANSVHTGCSTSQQNITKIFPEKGISAVNSVFQRETDKLPKVEVINTSTQNNSELLKLQERMDEKPILTEDMGCRKNESVELPIENVSEGECINNNTSALDGNGTTTRIANKIDIPSVKISAVGLQEGGQNTEEHSFASEDTYPKELNPFDEDDGEISEATPDENVILNKAQNTVSDATRTPVPIARKSIPSTEKKSLEAATVCLNPFWSDGEEPSSDEGTSNENTGKPPVPLPRTLIGVGATTPEPSPPVRKSLLTKSTKTGSMTSLSSINSSDGSARKKKPAPAPPINTSLSTPTSSRGSSPTPSSQGLSPTAPRRRKSRPAPPPPVSQAAKTLTFGAAKQLIAEQRNASQMEREKNQKDIVNLHRQSQVNASNSSCVPNKNGEGHPVSGVPNKSMYGQWKRKKGPAPPRPVPQRRQVKAMPMKEVARELEDIEVQQQELERQGVKLEQTIREKFDQSPNPNESSMTPDVEELVLQLFELVNQKNELFRRQAGLMYLRRQHRLEEEHADLEYQIRCLMEKPEHTKTDYDKAREEELIQQLVDVVERRNEVVECLELDRIREEEEDRSIHSRLGMLAGKSNENILDGDSKSRSGKKKKNKKSKAEKDKNLLKKTTKPMHDADKDVDEVEGLAPKHNKEKKTKLKWF